MRNLNIGTIAELKNINNDTPLSADYENLFTATANQFVVILHQSGYDNALKELKIIYDGIPEKLTVGDIEKVYDISRIIGLVGYDTKILLTNSYEPLRRVSVAIQYYVEYYKNTSNTTTKTKGIHKFLSSFSNPNAYTEIPAVGIVKKYTD